MQNRVQNYGKHDFLPNPELLPTHFINSQKYHRSIAVLGTNEGPTAEKNPSTDIGLYKHKLLVEGVE